MLPILCPVSLDYTQNLKPNDQMLYRRATFLQWELIFTWITLNNSLSFRAKLGRKYKVPEATQPANAQPPYTDILH